MKHLDSDETEIPGSKDIGENPSSKQLLEATGDETNGWRKVDKGPWWEEEEEEEERSSADDLIRLYSESESHFYITTVNYLTED